MRDYRNAMRWKTKRPVKPKPPRRPPIVIFAIVFVGTIAIGQGYLSGWFTRDNLTQVADQPLKLVSEAVGSEPLAVESQGERVSFSFCHDGGGENCVVDGDTIWMHGQKIRIADYDTPETHEPQCASERQLGDRATKRLQEILNSGSISLASIDRDEDQYGRKLRIVMIDGESVGDTLVDEGLARWYGNGRQPWC